MINKNIQKNKGYTLLFAVLVSSLILAVGISILNIAKKEFLLASSARESTVAIYAADSALECAVYHDSVGDFLDGTKASAIKCNNLPTRGVNATAYNNDVGAGIITYDFYVQINENSCAKVSYKNDASDVANRKVTVTSRGYNLGWDNINNFCTKASPRRVERALEYSYTY